MYIVVQHKVSDPATFWPIVRDAAPQLPPQIQVLQVLPNADGTFGICIWKADSIETIRRIVEPAVGHLSKNEYFAVETAKALGLPT